MDLLANNQIPGQLGVTVHIILAGEVAQHLYIPMRTPRSDMGHSDLKKITMHKVKRLVASRASTQVAETPGVNETLRIWYIC